MRELAKVALGSLPATASQHPVHDRYAPFGATLLAAGTGETVALRFNFSGLVITVCNEPLLAELVGLYVHRERAVLLRRLRETALEVLAVDAQLCERLILSAYEAGFEDATAKRPCVVFRKIP